MASGLTQDQEAATHRFIEIINNKRSSETDNVEDNGPISWATALKFLLARKFDVARATALYEQHELTRQREGLFHFDPSIDPLRSELATGKFTILPSRDASGAAIAVFTAHLHIPQQSSHQTTLQGVVYQLDVALQSMDTQRAGLVFIYDMSDSKYSNFDYDLSQKILMLLKGGYPAKLKKVLIVTAPLWFKAPFKILRLFVREKLRERVFTVSAPQLPQHIPRAALPKALGGPLQVDHAAWLSHCFKSLSGCNGIAEGQNKSKSHPIANGKVVQGKTTGDIMTSEFMCDIEDRINVPPFANGDVKMHITSNAEPIRDLNKNSNGISADTNIDTDKLEVTSSGDEEDLQLSPSSQTWCTDSLAEDKRSVSPSELLIIVTQLRRRGLMSEYHEIKSRPPDGTFLHSKLPHNLAKNRYNDVLCYDHSRVLLSQINENDPCSDYINANYVDGYQQKNAFISTQGPLPSTFSDFWRMVWEQHSMVIVMTTSTIENGRPKCGQYWPPAVSQQCRHGHFNILTETVEANPDYIVSELVLTNLQTDESRQVSHWQFIRWPDYGVPGSAGPVLRFLAGVRARQAHGLISLGDTWAGHARGPPIVVHCSAGIGRTGTFCTLDSCISQMEDRESVDVKGTVERIRSQRAYSIQTPDQYVFCYLALIEYAVTHGFLLSAELEHFNEDSDTDAY